MVSLWFSFSLHLSVSFCLSLCMFLSVSVSPPVSVSLSFFLSGHDVSLVQVWVSVLCFCLGLVMEGAMAMIGLLAMDCAPEHLQGTAHGIACSMAQGEDEGDSAIR